MVMDLPESSLSFVIAALISLFLPSLAYLISIAGAFSFFVLGLSLLSNKFAKTYVFKLSPFFELSFGGDSISGFFLIVISILTIAVCLYSIGYTKSLKNQRFFGFLLNLFIPSMYGVILSTNIISFLICWETMSVLSYFLVVFENNEKSSKAGLIYAVMTHIGTAFIIALFLLLGYYTKSSDFSVFKALSNNIPLTVKNIIFIFALIGFGVKAGIMPFHYWLPIAHPTAPSNVSAIMSGVMIKTGIYGIVRIGLDIMGGGAYWWGILVLALGAISAVLGIMQAVMEKDIKRLLAYSSIENIGIILLGLGGAMLFKFYSMNALAALSLTAAFYHILNHSVFKELLFMGAGSILHATHTKNMELLGGLIKKMPMTAFCFLIGTISICALPPFNGFVSEWLTYQALISGFNAPSSIAKIISPIFGASLALTGAIAATAFVKAFGITFLGLPRSSNTDHAHDASPTMTSAMLFLSVICLVLGIFPNYFITLFSYPVFNLTGESLSFLTRGSITIAAGSLSTQAIALSLILTVVFILVLSWLFFRKPKIEYGDSWDCGIFTLDSRMQYTATAFIKPLKIIFKRVYMPKREVKITYSVDKLFVSSMRYGGDIAPFLTKYILSPMFNFINNVSDRLKFLQSGSLQLYLSYILITLVVLLIFGM